MAKQRTPQRQMNGKRLVLLVAVFAFSCVGVYAAHTVQVNRNTSAMRTSAKRAAESGNNAEAMQLYTRYLNFQPKDTDALAEYTAILDAESKSNPSPKSRRELADAYERMLRVSPERAEERQKLVDIYMKAQYYPGAQFHLQELLKTSRGLEKDSETLVQLALCERRGGQTAKAIETYQRLIDSRQASSEIYLQLAEIYRNEIKTTESIDKADSLMEQLTRDKPNDVAAQLARTKYLFNKGDREEARKLLRTTASAVKEPEKNPEFVVMLVDSFASDNRLPEARELLDRAILANPRDARLMLIQAEVVAKSGDKTRSIELLRQAVSTIADSDLLAIEALDRMIEANDLVAAKTEIDRRYAGKDAYQPTHDYLTGRLVLLEGNWSAALPKLNNSLTYLQSYPRYYSRALASIGESYLLANNPDLALDAFQKSILADTQSDAGFIGKADAQLRLGKYTDAQATIAPFAKQSSRAKQLLVSAKYSEVLSQPITPASLKSLETVIGQPPYPVAVELVRSHLLQLRGQPAEAETLLRSLVTTSPKDATVRTTLAYLLAAKSIPDADAVLTLAESEIGDRAAFRLARANLICRGPKPDADAIVKLGDNVSKMPNSERYALAFGLADLLYSVFNQREKSLEFYRRAAIERPYDVGSRALLVQLLLEQNRSEDATRVLGELKALEGENGPMYLFGKTMQDLLTLKKSEPARVAELRARLEKVREQRPTWPRTYVALGYLSDFVEQPEEALVNYRKAYQLGDRSEAVLRKLVEIYRSRGLNDDARQILQDRLRLGTIPDDLRMMLALLTAVAGKTDDATRAAVLKSADSKNHVEQMFRGNWFLLNGEKAEAAKAFENTVTLNPQQIEAWPTLIGCYAELGNVDKAKATYSRAVEALALLSKPEEQARVAIALGTAQELLGDIPTAKSIYQAALIKQPDSQQLMFQLMNFYRRNKLRPELMAYCAELVSKPSLTQPLIHEARRTLAIQTVMGNDAYQKLPEALAIIEKNVAEGADPADVRAKGFILALDPFRRTEGRRMIDSTLNLGTLSPDENARLGMLFLQEGDLNSAQSRLREAVDQPSPQFDHLLLLHRVQVQAKRYDGAQTTLERLTRMAPTSWEVAVETARQLLARGDKSAASSVLLKHPFAAKPELAVSAVVPVLLEFQLTSVAAEVLAKLDATPNLPAKPIADVLVQIQLKEQFKALATLSKLPSSAISNAVKLRLYSDAVTMRPRAVVPAGEQATWDAAIAAVIEQVSTMKPESPSDPSIAFTLGVIHDARGNYPAALSAYQDAIRINPNHAATLNNVAYLQAMMGPDCPPSALEAIDKAIAKIGPRSALIDTRAIVRVRSGKGEAALVDMIAALSLDQKPSYYFHAALAAENLKDVGKVFEFMGVAKQKGLVREDLHPLEWSSYDRVLAFMTQP